MSNVTASYAPDEPASTVFLERTFLAGDVIVGLGYGIQLCMFGYCASYLWAQRAARKSSRAILAYIAALFVVETIFVGVQARTVQLCYIDNRNYPGGPWAYFLATQNLPVNVMFEATLFIITFMCDCLLLWRCWIIWTASGRTVAYFVTMFPALILLASFAMGVLWTLQSSQPGLSFYSALPLAYGISYYALSLSVNMVLTALIIIRLYQYRRMVTSTLPAEYARHYVTLGTVFVESAALYSVFALTFLITYAVNNPINQVFLSVAQATQQISTYLIIYRLADGSAWKVSTMGDETMTTLHFGGQLAKRKTRADIDGELFGPDASTTGITSPSSAYLADKEPTGQLRSTVFSIDSVIAMDRRDVSLV